MRKAAIPPGEKSPPLRIFGVVITAAILLAGALASTFSYMKNRETSLGQMRELVVRDAVSMGTQVRANMDGYHRGIGAAREIINRTSSPGTEDFRKILQHTLPREAARCSVFLCGGNAKDKSQKILLTHGEALPGIQKDLSLSASPEGNAILPLLGEAIDGEPIRRVVRVPFANGASLPAFVVIAPTEDSSGKPDRRMLVGIFSLEDLIEGVLDQSTTLSYDMAAYTKSQAGRRDLMYSRTSTAQQPVTETEYAEASNAAAQSYRLGLGDASLHMVFTPTTEWIRRNYSAFPNVILFLGMAMTGTLATLFVYKSRRAHLVEDLVHQRTAELALATMRLDESRGTLSSLLEACPDAINGKDNLGRWTFANRAFLQMAGIKETFPYKGLRDDEVIARARPANRKFLELRAELDRQVLAEGEGLRREMAIEAPGLPRRHLDIHMLPVRGSDGGTVGVVAVYNDVTELRRRINALQRSRERVKLLVENTATAIVEWDAEFRLIHWNPAAARLFGYDREQVLNQPISFFADPEAVESSSLALDSFIRERDMSIPQIFRHRNRRGNFVTCEWQNTPLIDEEGRPLGVTSFVYDVTERTKAEQALRKRDSILRGLAGSAAGFLNSDSWEPEAGELLRHLVDSLALSRVALVRLPVSEPAAQVYTVLEWVNPLWNGSPLMDANGGMDPHTEACRAGMGAYLISNGETCGPVDALPATWGHLLAAQGTRSLLLLPLRIQGEIWGFLRFDDCRLSREWSRDEVDAMRVVGAVMAGAIARQNLTKDRLQIEKRLHLSQKRESLGMLAGGIARDFNNLVNRILGNASLGRTLAETDSTIDSCLSEIEENGLRASALCRQMLAYAGHGESQSGIASPNLVILDVLNGIDPNLHRRIHFRKELASGLPVMEVDVDQLRQAIHAILQNAIEAIGNNPGVIEIQTIPTAKAPGGGEGSEFLIRDNGSGMDLQVKDRVFDPFFSTKMTGRGLGLTLSQSIIEAHGGQIAVESAPGIGTTIRVVLPSRRPKPEIADQAPGQSNPTVCGNVLIVHDGRPVGHVTVLAFQQLGFNTEDCIGVDRAIKLLNAYPGRYQMVAVEPAAPGAEATTLQRLRIAAASAPVILLTSDEKCPVALKHFADEGLAVLLPGDLSPDSLRGAVATALANPR